MIKEIRFEIVNRLMTFLIASSKGNKYVEKLENSYKNNLLLIFFLVLSLLGIGSKYIQLYSFTNDAKHEYSRLLLKEEIWHTETNRSAAFARTQFRRAQEFEKENILLLKKISDLNTENEELRKSNERLKK